MKFTSDFSIHPMLEKRLQDGFSFQVACPADESKLFPSLPTRAFSRYYGEYLCAVA